MEPGALNITTQCVSRVFQAQREQLMTIDIIHINNLFDG